MGCNTLTVLLPIEDMQHARVFARLHPCTETEALNTAIHFLGRADEFMRAGIEMYEGLTEIQIDQILPNHIELELVSRFRPLVLTEIPRVIRWEDVAFFIQPSEEYVLNTYMKRHGVDKATVLHRGIELLRKDRTNGIYVRMSPETKMLDRFTLSLPKE